MSTSERKKTLIILGAGSTADLKIPTSSEQANILKGTKKDGSCLSKLRDIAKDLYDDNFEINDIFNIVDSSIALGKNLSTKDGKTKLSCDELRLAKKELLGAIFDNFREKIKDREKEKYEKLVQFYVELGRNELRIKNDDKYELAKRENFIANYTIVNFNWDLYSIFPLVEAHRKLNHEKQCGDIAEKGKPIIKIYTDFNCDSASSLGTNGNPWYPITEPVANTINNDKWGSSRRVILVKSYYPHGLMNMYRCSGCGRHSLYIGSVEKGLNIDAVNENTRKDDVYDCPYCGSKIGKMDFEALPQSNFKVRSPYLEELRLAFYEELARADRIIFIGYSLPEDDIEMRMMFKAYCSTKEVYVVLKSDEHQGGGFVKADKIDIEKEEIARYKKVFNNDSLFFNMNGFFEAIDDVLKIINEDSSLKGQKE